MKYIVRPFVEADIPYIVGYYQNLSPEDCARMGVRADRLASAEEMTEQHLRVLRDPPKAPSAFVLVWELNGQPIGMNTIKDMTVRDRGNMHLHMWAKDLRGKGHGARFFCLAALEFYRRFSLKQIFCEPKVDNPAPNQMLQKLGFELIKTHRAASSAIAEVCDLNRYLIDREVCQARVNAAIQDK